MLSPRQKRIMQTGLLQYLKQQKKAADISVVKIETMLDDEENINYFTAHLLQKSEYKYETLRFVADFVKKTITIIKEDPS